MGKLSLLEDRLKRAFDESPEPILSEDLDERLLARIRAGEQPSTVGQGAFSTLEAKLLAAFRFRDCPPAEGYERAKVALLDAYARERVPGIGQSELSEQALIRAEQSLARRLKALTAPREEEPEVVFAGLALRFAVLAVPCSLAVIVFTMLTTEPATDPRPLLVLFGEGQSF